MSQVVVKDKRTSETPPPWVMFRDVPEGSLFRFEVLDAVYWKVDSVFAVQLTGRTASAVQATAVASFTACRILSNCKLTLLLENA